MDTTKKALQKRTTGKKQNLTNSLNRAKGGLITLKSIRGSLQKKTEAWAFMANKKDPPRYITALNQVKEGFKALTSK